ncbi:MAG: hypothetical protein ABIS43_02000 [Opitutus sp.]
MQTSSRPSAASRGLSSSGCEERASKGVPPRWLVRQTALELAVFMIVVVGALWMFSVRYTVVDVDRLTSDLQDTSAGPALIR